MSEDEPTESVRPRRRLFDIGFLLVLAVALISAALCWYLKGPEVFFAVLGAEATLAAMLLPKIFAGVLVASTLPLLVPTETVRRLIGRESGIRGLLAAMVAGALIPGGPSVTLPLVAGIVAAGADFGAAIAMVSGWVLLGVNRTLIWELSFLPGDLVAYRFLISLPVPILLGLAARALYGRLAGC